ncbi:MAG: polysaccharide deacetylase family protein [Alicyclobacillus macrosporangiidus]|uniref:polysaccharide deacetylase family protein n=1 Tax=Alicyclobacillus macrosporangiidus TaxID=392015 RepID=UPI0026F270FC|nr:polysaccharide deacetylase family protein [Alicyclobacillus macrosporangiidus]MCL6598379.1 polysaccharide deacetylase family protein [Alicyclobacillus macrosporangiidus]
MWIWVAAVVAVYVAYAPLAELVCKYIGIGTLKRSARNQRVIALTFDDGPDPRYTPKVLDVLAQHSVRATFFVVGERAKAHPELIRRMVSEGHQVAPHAQRHVHAWLSGPLRSWRNVAEAKRTVESLTGRPVTQFRPPWGGFNSVQRLALARLGLTPVLWSVRAIDWNAGDHAAAIARRVKEGAHPGAIVLCHDAGGADGAPLNTLRALPDILAYLRRLNYTFVTTEEAQQIRQRREAESRSLHARYPWSRRLLIRLWRVIEYLFTIVHHVRDVNSVFRFGLVRWWLGERRDADGRVVVRDGAIALDIHFQNDSVITFATENPRVLLRGLREAREGFHDIALTLMHDPRYRDVEVVFAITLINKGMDMLGFHIEDLPPTFTNRFLMAYMSFLLGMHHPEGFSRLRRGAQPLEMRLMWMTREELFERYGSLEARRRGAGAGEGQRTLRSER